MKKAWAVHLAEQQQKQQQGSDAEEEEEAQDPETRAVDAAEVPTCPPVSLPFTLASMLANATHSVWAASCFLLLYLTYVPACCLQHCQFGLSTACTDIALCLSTAEQR